MTGYKRLNLGLFVCAAFLSAGSYLYWFSLCGGRQCSLYLIDYWLAPSMWGGLCLATIFLFLMFFPARLFANWFFLIFSWGFPLSIFFIATANPNTSFGIGAGEMARLLGLLFGAVTVLFVGLDSMLRRFALWRTNKVMH